MITRESREKSVLSQHDSAFVPGQTAAGPASRHGLRSRAHRFESCWGRPPTTTAIQALSWAYNTLRYRAISRRAAASGYGVRGGSRAGPAGAGAVSAAALAWPVSDDPRVSRRERSGRARFREGQVEGLLEAERHALGVGPLQLLIAQVRTRLVQAVPAVTRIEILPRNARPVLKGLRDAVQRSCPVPVARIPGQAGQAEDGEGHVPVVAVPAADPQGGLERGPGAVEVSLRAQHVSPGSPAGGVLPSDLLRGLCRGFQVSPGGRDVPGVQCSSAGVVVQDGVGEMVAGSFGAGDRLGVQRPGPGRVDGP